MGTQVTGRKRIPNKDRLSAEDDALNQIAREAEARLAAKRAARAEAREIRMKELERQQKEIYQAQKRYYGLDNKWGHIEQWMEESERYSRLSLRHTSISDDEERMSVGSRGSLRVSHFLDQYCSTSSLPSLRQHTNSSQNGRPSVLYSEGQRSHSQRGSVCEESVLSSTRRCSGSSARGPSDYSGFLGSSSRASSRASSARASPVVEERSDRDFLEKGSRTASTLSAATLASLGGASSRRGSCDTSFSVETEASIREIKDSLVESEEKYRKAMVSNAQLHNEKSNLMYQVDTLKESLIELEERLWESQREYSDKAKEFERERHAHSVLQFQFSEMRETLKQSEELLTEVGELRLKRDSSAREISDLQEALEWKEKKIGALERQRGYSEAVMAERNLLRDQVVHLSDALKKHGIELSPEVTTNGATGDRMLDDALCAESGSRLAQEAQPPHVGGESMLGRERETQREQLASKTAAVSRSPAENYQQLRQEILTEGEPGEEEPGHASSLQLTEGEPAEEEPGHASSLQLTEGEPGEEEPGHASSLQLTEGEPGEEEPGHASSLQLTEGEPGEEEPGHASSLQLTEGEPAEEPGHASSLQLTEGEPAEEPGHASSLQLTEGEPAEEEPGHASSLQLTEGEPGEEEPGHASSLQLKTSRQDRSQMVKAETSQQATAYMQGYLKLNDQEISDGLLPLTHHAGPQPHCSTEDTMDSPIKLTEEVLVDLKCSHSCKDKGYVMGMGGCQLRDVRGTNSTENVMGEVMSSGEQRRSDPCADMETPCVRKDLKVVVLQIVPKVSSPRGKYSENQMVPELVFTFGFVFGFALGIAEEQTRASQRARNDVRVCPSNNLKFDSELRMTPTSVEEDRMKQDTVRLTKASDLTALSLSTDMDHMSDVAILDISTSTKNNKSTVYKHWPKKHLERENSLDLFSHRNADDMVDLVAPLIEREARGGLAEDQVDGVRSSSARLVNVSSPGDQTAGRTCIVSLLELETCPDWIVLDLHSFTEGEDGSVREQGFMQQEGFRNGPFLQHQETREEESVEFLDSCEEALYLEEEMAVVWQSQPDPVEGGSDVL